MDNIHNLKLHEDVFIETENNTNEIQVIRVPGGWIYHFWEKGYTYGGGQGKNSNDRINSVFVPLNDEFMRKNSNGK